MLDKKSPQEIKILKEGGRLLGGGWGVMRSRSLYYGSPVSKNAFPSYSTADLERDLQAPSLDAATRARIEAEIARRAAAKRRKG